MADANNKFTAVIFKRTTTTSSQLWKVSIYASVSNFNSVNEARLFALNTLSRIASDHNTLVESLSIPIDGYIERSHYVKVWNKRNNICWIYTFVIIPQ